MSDLLARIAAELKAHTSVLISVHRDLDGDALGSQLALMLALEKLGKKVRAHNLDPVPEIYQFLPGSDRVGSGKPVAGSYDVFVVLDSEPQRTGLFDDDYPAATHIDIDHHETNRKEWPLTWLDTKASATGEMVYRLVKTLQVPIDREIALCLFTAIFTDTGSYRYSNTTPQSLRISAELLETGINPWLVALNVYETFAYNRIKLLGNVLAGIERNADGRIAWVVVPNLLYEKTGTTSKDTENFINFVRSVKGVEVAVLFRQTGELQYKVSLRSKGQVDVSIVAQALGGGGHKNAAGCTLNGRFEDIKSVVIGRIEKELGPR